MGVGIGVVHAAKEDVFESEVLPRAEGLGAAGGEKIAQVPLLRDGHDFLALLFVRGVEGDGEFGAHGGLAEFFHAVDDAGGGDGDAAFAHADAAFVAEDAGGFEDVVEVEERFALAHHDDVHLARGGVHAVAGGGEEDLADNFARGEIALEAHEGREAELAIDGAADLRRNAEGVAAVFGHEDGFDGAAVVEREEVAVRAIGRGELLRNLRPAEVGVKGEVVAQRLGQSGDRSPLGNAFAVGGFVELFGAEGGLAWGQQLFDFGEFPADECRFHQVQCSNGGGEARAAVGSQAQRGMI